MLFYASKTKTNPDDEAEEVEKIMVYYAEEKAVGIKTMRGYVAPLPGYLSIGALMSSSSFLILSGS